jgi:glycosyltransferase involved in cell wall biosynthesis
VLLAETPEEFALAILRVWNDAPLAAELAEAAHERVRERYSFATSRRAVADALRGIVPGV